MNATDKLILLQSKCKCGIFIEINSHRDYCETVQHHIDDMPEGRASDLDSDILLEMIARDTIIDLQFYPNTPIGFYNILHYDIEMALDEALALLEDKKRIQVISNV